MRAIIVILMTAFAATLAAAPISIAPFDRKEPVDFSREVYPLLKRNCLACHNTTKAKSNLNLETPELMVKGGDGGAAIVPGKGAESLLVKSAAHQDEDLIMPPPTNAVKAVALTSAELGLVQAWIDQGAKGSAVPESVGPLPWRPVAAGPLPVSAVTLSPGGKFVAFARGNRVEVGEVATGRTVEVLDDPGLATEELWKGQEVADRDAVMSVAFADENLIATGGWRAVRIWRRAPQEIRRKIGVLPEAPTALVQSRDGRWMASGDAKGAVRLWDTTAEKFEPFVLNDQTAPISALVFSPDGQLLLSAAQDRTVRIWQLSDRTVVYASELSAPALTLTFVQDGKEIAAGFGDGFVRVWAWLTEPPAEPAKPVREFQLQQQPITSLVANADGSQLAWIAADGTLNFSEAATGKPLRKVPLEHPAGLRVIQAEREVAIAQSILNTRKARATAATEAAKKETENAKKTPPILEQARTELRRLQEALDAVAEAARANPEDKKLTDAVKPAETAFAAGERAFRAARTNAELSARLSADAASAQASAEVAVTSAEAGAAQAQTRLDASRKAAGEPIVPQQLALSADGVYAVVTYADQRARIFAVEGGQFLDQVEQAVLVSIGSDGNALVAAADKSLRATAIRRGWKLERTIGKPEAASTFADRVLALSFSPDRRLLATAGGEPSRTGELKVWRVADGSLVRAWERPHSDTINAVAFSPDGEFLATGASDRLVRVWRVADGERVNSFEGHSGHVYGVAWRRDAFQLASGGADKSLRLWDLLDRKLIKTTADFGREVNAVGFAGNGDLLFAASGDKAIRVGDQPLPESVGYVQCAATDALGRYVAAGASDGTVRIWSAIDRKLTRLFAVPNAPNSVTSR